MKVHCLHSNSKLALETYAELSSRYSFVSADEADVVLVLGGDGMLLHSIHELDRTDLPLYGMNCGTVGFLMNLRELDGVMERIANAKKERLVPLRMDATCVDGSVHSAIAFNEVSIIRYSGQSANLRLTVDDKVRLEKLMCDGVLVATAAGSTAYNFSAHGPIVPLGSGLLALTPVSAFRPRRWRGALLPGASRILIENLDPVKRPLGASADSTEVRDVASIEVREAPEHAVTVLFDPNHSLEERIINEQFAFQ